MKMNICEYGVREGLLCIALLLARQPSFSTFCGRSAQAMGRR